MSLDTLVLVESLQSSICPACGKAKKARQTLCYSCYRRLSPTKKAALYDLVGEGYEEAVQAAFDALGVTDPVLPSKRSV